MVDWVVLLLKAVHIYCYLIGLSNFEFDCRTGRVFKSRRCTIYAFMANIFILITIIYNFTAHGDTNLLFQSANKLHEYVIIIMSGLKIVAGLITVLNRWLQRGQMMQLVKDVIRLYMINPQLKSMIRWGILLKAFISFAIELLQVTLSVDALDRQGTAEMMGLLVKLCVSFIMNLAISQHFLVILLIRAQYRIMNAKLRMVIEESRRLSFLQLRNGAFMTRCCYLSDQLEDIGEVQSQLQSMVGQLDEVFGMQGLMAYSEYYLSIVGTSYMSYSIYKYGPHNLKLSAKTSIIVCILITLFYLDALVNCNNMLRVLDHHKDFLGLLEERTVFASSLDIRLEESFESLQLQLARNPLKINVMGMFPITRGSTAAMCASVIVNSIFLIQFDMEFF
uniref:Putative gustatory receptor 36b n=1 Tax=Drosophila melanogaster TaxID=7227 RepID=GR36B_DROME|nr:gustatory receptor 36b [Drosophila melanogaster]Q9VJF2.2 RecName: Full=Putative gustatory receptor 36b [Drosophila melanogaster]AAF53597.2 gustatory receptor 36b [Drosophila melanogaster]|eukprot:NP_724039.1 gustatory receptor 36b [Drosophila melanogaster]